MPRTTSRTRRARPAIRKRTSSPVNCNLACYRPFRRKSPMRSLVKIRRKAAPLARSEEHTSELQSLMRISYAVVCLKQKIQAHHNTDYRRATPTHDQQNSTTKRHPNTHTTQA